jgi:hypothetical protein
MSRTTQRTLEILAIALILLGIFSLCQPWTFALYRYGFTILLIGTISFTVVSHL